jgi:Uma2 family endonuclease
MDTIENGGAISTATPTSAIIPSPARASSAGWDRCVVLRFIGWSGYRTMLRVRGERNSPRMIYLDGDLWLMSPSFSHERPAERLGLLVMIVVEELDIPCVPAGHTTFRRRKRESGVEGDKTFYLTNEGRVRGKRDIDLRVDPAPDLVIEAVYTNSAAPAEAVWRRLGVPEIWTCDEDRLRIQVRQADGGYVESESSLALPLLGAGEVFDLVNQPQTASETDWIKGARRWVREILVPRVRGQGG